MKCTVCAQKKGKRTCPAKNAPICAQCCGTGRILDIPCPESCAYLREGREREAEEYSRLVRSLEPKAQERNRRVLQAVPNVIGRLEYALARARFLSRDLVDGHVAQAVDLLLENYRTEEKGVLYEKTSADLRVESLRRELREILELFRNPGSDAGPAGVKVPDARLTLGVATECLEYLRSLVGAFQAGGRSASAYVDFLARFFPREETPHSIVLP